MIFSGDHAAFLDELYERYLSDSGSIDPEWRRFFDSLNTSSSNGGNGHQALRTPSAPTALFPRHVELPVAAGIGALIDAYRRWGHQAAHLDPLGLAHPDESRLIPSLYGLSESDLDSPVIFHRQELSARDVIARLRRVYCSTSGIEYMHLESDHERAWLEDRIEDDAFRPLETWMRLRIFEKLFQADSFEKFLARTYPGKKRFSLEGGETLIPLLDMIFEEAGAMGMKHLVLGMAHRGRLNVLVNVLEKPAGFVFAEFEEKYNPTMRDYADVKYHLGYSNHKMTRAGHEVGLTLMFNPSHLEAVNPVVLGSIRARQHLYSDTDRTDYMAVLIHGDAAFPGQGVVAETLNLMNLRGYTVGGTFHIVINNQIGFTTLPPESRSTRYCTDLARGFDIPIFHVNADDPDAVIRMSQLAMEYRRTFHKDVVMDVVCYRRLGHNEMDEPAFTQPVMYEKIRALPPTVDLYEKHLLKSPDISAEDIEFIKRGSAAGLEHSFKRAKDRGVRMASDAMRGRWARLSMDALDSDPQTKLLGEQMVRISKALTEIPEDFTPHAKLAKLVETRAKMARGEQPIDWGFAEAMAFGSILENGFHIRLSGQDVERGTFSHRHAVLVDAKTQKKWTPLSRISEGQGVFEAVNSPLSEYAVLGFEYGYSVSDPGTLVIWEAQFGDFANGAQIMIDQFIASSEVKWLRVSGLVMLLPHGYEGQGPEHSSARVERFLQLCALRNIQVANCTTPAQYFHLLRRQILRNYRKPLVIVTPKSLLRFPAAVSSLDDIGKGVFREVLYDFSVQPENVRRVLLCSGKIYYDLAAEREKSKATDVAILRIEQLYPFPYADLAARLPQYTSCREFIWVQEEPENMGAWFFIRDRLQSCTGGTVHLIARPESSSPAAGLYKLHEAEQHELAEKAFAGRK